MGGQGVGEAAAGGKRLGKRLGYGQAARQPCGWGWVMVAGGGAGLGVAGGVAMTRCQTRPGGPELIVPPIGMGERAAMVAGCYAHSPQSPPIPSGPRKGRTTFVQEIYFFCNKISL